VRIHPSSLAPPPAATRAQALLLANAKPASLHTPGDDAGGAVDADSVGFFRRALLRLGGAPAAAPAWRSVPSSTRRLLTPPLRCAARCKQATTPRRARACAAPCACATPSWRRRTTTRC
jgi:hypothetical protein